MQFALLHVIFSTTQADNTASLQPGYIKADNNNTFSQLCLQREACRGWITGYCTQVLVHMSNNPRLLLSKDYSVAFQQSPRQ